MRVMIKKVLVFMMVLVFGNMVLKADILKLEKTISMKKIHAITKIRVAGGFIYGQAEHSIVAFNENGDVVKKYGRKGKGPGDFNLLADFFIKGNNLFGADFNGSVNNFNMKGNLVRSYKLPDRKIKKIYSIGNSLAYLYSKWEIKNKKLVDIKLQLKQAEKVIFSAKDESKLNPYNPGRKGKMPFPWFPAPFPKTAFVVMSASGVPVILNSKDSSSMYIRTVSWKKYFTSLQYQRKW